MLPLLLTAWLASTPSWRHPNRRLRTIWLDWILLLEPRNTGLPGRGRKNAGNALRFSIELALPVLLLVDLSSAGSPIDVRDDNTLGSFAFDTR